MFLKFYNCLLRTIMHFATARAVPPIRVDVDTVAVGPHRAPGLVVVGVVQRAPIVHNPVEDEGEDAALAALCSRFGDTLCVYE